MKISLTQLIKCGACEEQQERFVELFGGPVEVTEELALSVAGVFDWDWARVLLPRSMRAEYTRVCDSAWHLGHPHASANDWAKYNRLRASTWARCYNQPEEV